jgi:alpha-tubulin suppressor-like RCC1 family protein
MTSLRTRLVALTLLLGGGCSGGESTGPGTAAKLAFTVQPANTPAVGSFSVAVTIEDASGHIVTNTTNQVTLAIGYNPVGGVLGGATATTIAAVNGVAAFNSMAIVKAAQGYTLTATSPGLTTATSVSFDITPGPPYGLAFAVEPRSTPLGTSIPAFQVSINDAVGNRVTTDTASVTLALSGTGGGTLVGHTTVQTVFGAATFDSLKVNRPGAHYQLSATAAGFQNAAVSDSFDITIAFKSVSAGDLYTCGVSNAGAAYCWGENNVGQLGIGISGEQTSPVPVVGGLKFSVVSAGERHSCGITTASPAYCWGSDSAGALGDGTATGSDSAPVAVLGSQTFVSLSATGASVSQGPYPGGGFSCGITTSNAAYCWGDNSAGELGNASTTNSATPVPVSGALLFATVSVGGGPHACGVTSAGAAYCWGDNSVGELGTGTSGGSTTPVAVAGSLSFVAVRARNGHACGLTTAGKAYCWGLNTRGQLGDSSAAGPAQCVAGGTSYACSTSPDAVSGGLVFTSLTTGWFHTCGLTSAGAAYCWGYNAEGQLGSGSAVDSSLVPVPVAGGLTFVAISAGSLHTCGLTSAGAVYCWGDDTWGELGDGREGAGVFSNVPVLLNP